MDGDFGSMLVNASASKVDAQGVCSGPLGVDSSLVNSAMGLVENLGRDTGSKADMGMLHSISTFSDHVANFGTLVSESGQDNVTVDFGKREKESNLSDKDGSQNSNSKLVDDLKADCPSQKDGCLFDVVVGFGIQSHGCCSKL